VSPRARFAVHVLVAGAPLLALALWVVAGAGRPGVFGWVCVLWLVSVALLGRSLWRRAGAPLHELLGQLQAVDLEHGQRQIRALESRIAELEQLQVASADLLEDLSGGLGEGLVVVSADLHIRLVNPTALVFFGCDEIALGSHLLDVLRAPEAVTLVKDAVGGGRRGRCTVENRRGLWDVRVSPIHQEGAVLLISEVSLIQRATQLRRRFIQDLSHELRSPLAVLRTTVESLEDEVAPKVAQILVRQIERITRLAEELYQLSTIETGQLELKPEEVQLAAILSEVERDLRAVAQEQEVEIRQKVAVTLKLVVDPRALYRVISNLVDNAIKYNHKGGWVSIVGSMEEETISVVVTDSGRGIPASELQAVTQRFYRVDDARTPGESGLGLGLAIVKHMVQQMGGKLQLDSQRELGTTVTVTLPRSQAAPEAGNIEE